MWIFWFFLGFLVGLIVESLLSIGCMDDEKQKLLAENYKLRAKIFELEHKIDEHIKRIIKLSKKGVSDDESNS